MSTTVTYFVSRAGDEGGPWVSTEVQAVGVPAAGDSVVLSGDDGPRVVGVVKRVYYSLSRNDAFAVVESAAERDDLLALADASSGAEGTWSGPLRDTSTGALSDSRASFYGLSDRPVSMTSRPAASKPATVRR